MAYPYENPFTYRSTAGTSQPVASFQDLLDAERKRTADAVATQQAATPAPAAPGLASARNNTATEGSGNGGQGRSASNEGSVSNGNVSTGLGGYSVGMGETSATANTTGVSNTNAARAGGVAAGPIGSLAAGLANWGINTAAERSAQGFNENMQSAISGTETPGLSADDYGTANQAAAEAAASEGGYGGEDASSAGAVNGADSQSDAAGSMGNFGGMGSFNGASGNGRGGGGPSERGSHSDGNGSNSGDGHGFAQGGQIGLADVKQFTAGGPNGPGIDDGLVDSTVGDFILTAQRTQQIGAAALKALSEGRAEIVMLKGNK